LEKVTYYVELEHSMSTISIQKNQHGTCNSDKTAHLPDRPIWGGLLIQKKRARGSFFFE
jgi:hypothetical protein